jgi:hypothetical protein
MVNIGSKMLLEIIAKAYNNSSMKEVTEILMSLYESSQPALLNFMDDMLKDNCKYIFSLLLDCTDKVSRTNIMKLTAFIVNKCFDIEKDILNVYEDVEYDQIIEVVEDGVKKYKKIAKSYKEPKARCMKFLEMVNHTLKTKGPTAWTRFESFLGLIKAIVMGGQLQLNVMMKQDSILTYIDFMLGPDSPLCPKGDHRTKMGGAMAYVTPNFTPLVDAVSYMILHCYTPSFDENSTVIPPRPDGVHAFQSTLDDKLIRNLILNQDFLTIAVKNASELMGYAFSHLSFNNLEISETVGVLILKALNGLDSTKVESCLAAAKPFLCIDDDFKHQRAEWILGVPSLETDNVFEKRLNKFGIAHAYTISGNIHEYQTPLYIEGFKQHHPLLQLIYSKKGTLDYFVILGITGLLQIVSQSEFLFEYMFRMSPPTYQFARYTDWIRPYLDKEMAKTFTTYAIQPVKKREKINESNKILEVFENKCRAWELKQIEGAGVDPATIFPKP